MLEQAREQIFARGTEANARPAANAGAADAAANVTAFKPKPEQTDFDVIIVGAGLSGIGVAYHLQRDCPKKSFIILEGREALGGTWDLFRYPGIRSDSDMHTLGYRFRPWRGEKAIADGPSILDYLNDTAREYGIDRSIRFRHKVQRASWSSSEARWTLEVEGPDGKKVTYSCNFLQMCSGYYDYDAGYMPGWPGMERFKSEIVHPQKWPEHLDYAGKRVVVIGSGATAVTLVPAMTDKAAHVTMLQRSPTYIVARPAKDPIANWLYAKLPEGLAHTAARWKNILLQMYFYNAARKNPEGAKQRIISMVKAQLGSGIDAAKHFTPRYNPMFLIRGQDGRRFDRWGQRRQGSALGRGLPPSQGDQPTLSTTASSRCQDPLWRTSPGSWGSAELPSIASSSSTRHSARSMCSNPTRREEDQGPGYCPKPRSKSSRRQSTMFISNPHDQR